MPFEDALPEPALRLASREPDSARGPDARALLLVESHALVGGPRRCCSR